jgi:ribosomal protein S11
MRNQLLTSLQKIIKKSLKINYFFILNSISDSTKTYIQKYLDYISIKKLYICNIKSTKNNTFITISKLKENKLKNTIFTYSTGRNNLKQTVSITIFFGKILGEYIGLLLKKLKVSSLIIKINGISLFRKLFMKGLLKFNFNILFIEDTTSTPYNGCKFSKKKRNKKKFKLYV